MNHSVQPKWKYYKRKIIINGYYRNRIMIKYFTIQIQIMIFKLNNKTTITYIHIKNELSNINDIIT